MSHAGRKNLFDQREDLPTFLSVSDGESTCMKPGCMSIKCMIAIIKLYAALATRYKTRVAMKKVCLEDTPRSRGSALSGKKHGVGRLIDMGGDAVQNDLIKIEDDFKLDRGSITNEVVYDVVHSTRHLVATVTDPAQLAVLWDLHTKLFGVCGYVALFLAAISAKANTKAKFLAVIKKIHHEVMTHEWEANILLLNLTNALASRSEEQQKTTTITVQIVFPPFLNETLVTGLYEATVPAKKVSLPSPPPHLLLFDPTGEREPAPSYCPRQARSTHPP